jgi:predicted DNA binding protein
MIAECLVVEFRVEGDECPLADASAAANVTVDSAPPQFRSDGNALLQFSAPSDSDVATILDADDRIRYLHRSTANGTDNFRCLSKDPCVVHELTDVGFLVDRLRYRDGVERHVGAVVGYDVLEGVLEAAGDRVGVGLERLYPLGGEDTATVAQRWDLTPAQEAAVRAAVELGYFEVPRAASAAEVAASLDISKSAFLERLRRAEGRLFEQVL